MESKSRVLLTWSLGGLVFLTLLAGVAALIAFDRIRSGEIALRNRLVARNAALENVRATVYLSEAMARDYFAGPADARSEAVLDRLQNLKTETIAAMAQSSDGDLRGEVSAYWRLVDLMEDVASARRTPGLDSYFRSQLASRRETMLRIADSTSAAIEKEWSDGESEIARLYRRLRSGLTWAIVFLTGIGMFVSIATGRRLIRLEQDERELSARLLRAQEEERRSIARELHDEVGQALSILLLDAGGAARLDDTAEIRPRLQSISGLAERTMEAVRRISLSLRPSMLDDLGLVAALEWQGREVAQRSGIDVEVKAEDASGDLPDSHRTCIYRVAQEALQNCARHSSAKRVRIGLERAASRVVLQVEDDGHGFVTGRTRGLGLLGMEERVLQLGGRFRVQSEPGRGTVIRAELPL